MNKLGIKVYGDEVYELDGIDYTVNSINHEGYTYNDKCRYRIINTKSFGIDLNIKIKKKCLTY